MTIFKNANKVGESKELAGARKRLESLTRDRGKITAAVAEAEQDLIRARTAVETAEIALGEAESTAALEGTVADAGARKALIRARENVDFIGARLRGLTAKLRTVDERIQESTGECERAYNSWRRDFLEKTMDELDEATERFYEVVVRAYAAGLALGDGRIVTGLRDARFAVRREHGFGRPDPFTGLRTMWRRNPAAAELYDELAAVRTTATGDQPNEEDAAPAA